MCGGGFFKDSIILATGATGTAKPYLCQASLWRNGHHNKERVIVFAFEESRAQLMRNATSWGINFEQDGEGLACFGSICCYPESTGLEGPIFFRSSRLEISGYSSIFKNSYDSSLHLSRGV